MPLHADREVLEIEPQEAYDLLREAIPRRPELRYKEWPNVNPWIGLGAYTGACYIATQVFCHLVPEARPMCDGSRAHFWPEVNGERWDPTFDQFGPQTRRMLYADGRPTRFKQLSVRARELLSEVECLTR